MASEAREECPAVGKLDDWLKSNGKSQSWLAAQCGVKPPSVHAWMTRTSRPTTYLREIIEAVTDGIVPACDWEFPSEKRKRQEALEKKLRATDEQGGDAA